MNEKESIKIKNKPEPEPEPEPELAPIETIEKDAQPIEIEPEDPTEAAAGISGVVSGGCTCGGGLC